MIHLTLRDDGAAVMAPIDPGELRSMFKELAERFGHPPLVVDWAVAEFERRFPAQALATATPPIQVPLNQACAPLAGPLQALADAAGASARLGYVAERSALLGMTLTLILDL